MKSGNRNILEPSGPLQACNGTALPAFTYKRRICAVRFISFWIATGGALLWTWWRTFGLLKIWGVLWLLEALLYSHVELCCMELIIGGWFWRRCIECYAISLICQTGKFIWITTQDIFDLIHSEHKNARKFKDFYFVLDVYPRLHIHIAGGT
jgi:hypothetical protein